MKAVVCQGLNIPIEALGERCLGLPTSLQHSTNQHFDHILATIKKLVASWTPKLLNSARREIFIKAICQAIPTYSMSCFKLSKKLCNSSYCTFLSGGDETKRKMH